jgi:hypothetical protein
LPRLQCRKAAATALLTASALLPRCLCRSQSAAKLPPPPLPRCCHHCHRQAAAAAATALLPLPLLLPPLLPICCRCTAVATAMPLETSIRFQSEWETDSRFQWETSFRFRCQYKFPHE